MPPAPVAQRVGGGLLAAAALAGTLCGARAPARWGRRGGVLLVGGLALLAARDATMIASGSLFRLQRLPAALLTAESVTATASLALGAPAWLSRTSHPRSSARTASQLATVTFAVHALRQVIYLSPGQGRRATAGTPR